MNFPPEASCVVHMNTPAPEHILAKEGSSSSHPSVPGAGLQPPDSAEPIQLHLPSQKGILTPFTSWCWHTRLPCLPCILWQWLAVSLRLEEDEQLLQFRSEHVPAVWWLPFSTKASGDSKCGCNFFSTDICWESWEWAPLWPFTGWPPL